MKINRLAILVAFVAVLGILGSASAATSNVANVVLCTMYSVYQQTTVWLFIVAIGLMVLGACMYAGANMMPSQSRGGIQGYGMGMILGSMVGVFILVISPVTLNLISSGSSSSNIALVSHMCNPYNGISAGGANALTMSPQNTATSTSANAAATKAAPITTSTSVSTTSTKSTSTVSTSSTTSTIDYEELYCSPANANTGNEPIVCSSGSGSSSTDSTSLENQGCC